MKHSYNLLIRLSIVIAFAMSGINANAQFFKKLGKVIKKGVETMDKIDNYGNARTSTYTTSSSTTEATQGNVVTNASSESRKGQIAQESLEQWKENARRASGNSGGNTANRTVSKTSSTNSNINDQKTRKEYFTKIKNTLVGQYNTCGQVRNVYALFLNDTIDSYWIEPVKVFDIWGGNGGNLRGDAMIQIDNDSYSTLKKIAAKYKEWLKIAEDNKVGNFEKDIDIELKFGALFFKRSDMIMADGCKTKKFTFVRRNNNHGSLALTQTWKYRGTDQTADLSIIFATPDEFDKFVELFNPQKLKEYINFQKSGGLFH